MNYFLGLTAIYVGGSLLFLYIPFVYPARRVIQDSGGDRQWRAYVPLWGILVMYDFMGWEREALLWLFFWAPWVLFINPVRIGAKLATTYNRPSVLGMVAGLPFLNYLGFAALLRNSSSVEVVSLDSRVQFAVVTSQPTGRRYIVALRGGILAQACPADDWTERRSTERNIKYSLRRPEFYGQYEKEAQRLAKEGGLTFRIAGQTSLSSVEQDYLPGNVQEVRVPIAQGEVVPVGQRLSEPPTHGERTFTPPTEEAPHQSVTESSGGQPSGLQLVLLGLAAAAIALLVVLLLTQLA